MSVRLKLTLSNDLNDAINAVAEQRETNPSVVLQRALQLYLAATRGLDRGLKLGLCDPATEMMKTELTGL